MKLHSISRYKYPVVEDAHAPTEFSNGFINGVLLEAQDDYLAKKYPGVARSTILMAIEMDRKNAEKLVYGLDQGVIDELDENSLAAVAGLDPFAKVSNKSASDLAYDESVKRAKSISRDYWQWVVRVQNENPDINIDQGLFDYFDSEGVSNKDLLKLSFDEANEASHRWHEEQFANQKVGGEYTLGPNTEGTVRMGPFYWVPVSTKDSRLEGDKMQNCIGSYCKPSDTNKIISMRNKFNNPHVSLQIKQEYNGNQWEISQIKGKQNSVPVIKYVSPVENFVETLVRNQGVKIAGGSDFWRLPGVDIDKFIFFFNGDALSTGLSDNISDETLNILAQQNGYNGRDESVIKRLTIESVSKILTSGNLSSSNSSMFIIIAIRHKLISEEQGRELVETGKMPRGALMTLNSVYHPDEFIISLGKIHTEDLLLSFDNYKYGVEGFPGTHPIFTKMIRELSNVARDTGDWRQDNAISDMYDAVIPKVPTDDKVTLLTDLKEKYLDRSSSSNTLSKSMMQLLDSMKDLLTGDFETKYALLTGVPDLAISDELASVIVFSTPLDQLKQLNGLRIPKLTKHMQPLLAGLKELEGSLISRNDHHSISGTSTAVLDGADMVLDINDPDELRELRKSTKSRGIKKLVDRKLARLKRLEDATSNAI